MHGFCPHCYLLNGYVYIRKVMKSPIERLLWFKSEIATTETERAGSFARHENPLSWPFPLHAQTICHRIARTSVRFATNFSLSSAIFFISSRWIAANFRWKKKLHGFRFPLYSTWSLSLHFKRLHFSFQCTRRSHLSAAKYSTYLAIPLNYFELLSTQLHAITIKAARYCNYF